MTMALQMGGDICDEFAEKDNRIVVLHQKNKGSTEARRIGVLSEAIQQSQWVMLCDADDTLEKNALEKCLKAIRAYDVDMVAARYKRMYKCIKISSKSCPPCFSLTSPRKYEHKEIIDELFISFFGISDFPVSLCAKLYKTALLTEVIDHPSIVKFWGDDLCVSIRIMVDVKSIVIIPDTIYNYRIGGGTSKFTPYMMEDFVKLYSFKLEFARKVSMPQDAYFLMNVELLNVTKSHFLQCLTKGKYSIEQLEQEIKGVCRVPQVIEAARHIVTTNKFMTEYAQWVCSENISQIMKEVYRTREREKRKDLIRRILYSL